MIIKSMTPDSDIMSFSYYELSNGQYQVEGFDPEKDVLVLHGLKDSFSNTTDESTLADLKGDTFDGDVISVQFNPFNPSVLATFGQGGNGLVAIDIIGVTDASEINIVLA